MAEQARILPTRWTGLTWLFVLIWAWLGLERNIPPSGYQKVDQVTGKLSEPVRFNRWRDIEFPVGWPLYYITPAYFSGPLGNWSDNVFIAPPPATPANIYYYAIPINILIIAGTIASLVYVLQRYLWRFSLKSLLLVVTGFALFYGLGPWIGRVLGAWYFNLVYFSPLLIAVVVRFSLFSRWDWSAVGEKFVSKKRGDCRETAEDVFAAAVKLEKQGEWQAAEELYRQAGERWPEHAAYAGECVTRLDEKRSLSRK